MIAAWMLYCVGIGLALVVAGYASERALYLARQPTRWAWSFALLGTLLLPVAATVRPQAFSAIVVPLAEPAHASTAEAAATLAKPALPATPTSAMRLSDFDAVLRWGWGLSSGATLLVVMIAIARLRAARRRWRPALVNGRAVLVADDVGPAVAGFRPPQVVIPSWALKLADSQQRLLLAHEEEHVRARDPWLLAGGAAALVLAPWNPALWWLLRRLRLAVEMDCDARVLGRGHSVPDYGELLLQVGQHRASVPLTAAALGEPRSFLERRIHRMVERLPRWRRLGTAAALAVAAGAIVGACEAPRPVEPPRSPAATEVRPEAVMVGWMRAAIAKDYPEFVTTPANPPVALWFHGTTGGLVIRSSRTVGERLQTLSYREVQAQFPEAGPMRPGMWFGWAYPLGPRRDDVRAIWLHQPAGQPGSVSPAAPVQAPGHVLMESAVDERPEMLSGPQPEYPSLLRMAGIQGRVVVRAIIDSTGRAEPASVRVIQSPHVGFNESARDFVLGARFRPGRVRGQAVRVLTEVPITFRAGARPQDASLPLDMARAVEIARRNLCGEPSDLRDTTCRVETVERAGNQYIVVLERRPPAGKDRVVVRLRGDGENMDLEANQVAPRISRTSP